MPSWSSRIDTGVEGALSAYVKRQQEHGRATLPVDPEVLAEALGNIELEAREMIPEAAMVPAGSKFRIFVRSNFIGRPGRRVRGRFSLAHEIAHTFFFEYREDVWKPMRGAPRGIALESACHEAASRLLVPERFLPSELKERREISGEHILRLAEMFDVSLEVVLRRLRNHPAVESQDLSFALCRLTKIQYAMYPPWLGSILAKPANTTIESWFRTSDVSLQRWFSASGLDVEELSTGSYIGTGPTAVIAARRLAVGRSTDLFEIRRYPAEFPRADLRSKLSNTA